MPEGTASPAGVIGGRFRQGRSEFSIVVANFRRHKLAVAGLIVLFILAFSAVFAPLISPFDPYEVNLAITRDGYPVEPSLTYIWGTDNLGRDYFSRAMYGGRISLSVGFVAVAIAISLGTLVGMLSGYFGGIIDQALMRTADLALSFPPLIILLALASIMTRPSIFMIMVIIGALQWMTTARLVRAEVLSLKEYEFVTAARAIGGSDRRIILVHLLRNTLSPIIVAASLGIPQAILTESTLSFLGVGVQVPTPSWGNMLTLSLRFMKEGAWWVGVYPGLLIALAVLSFNFVGDGLRDAFDPRLRTR
jgi:peptide/nickel transport system permease protein